MDAAPIKSFIAGARRGFEFRPGKRKAGAGPKPTKTLAHSAFTANTFRGGRTSPSEGQASGGGGI